MNLLLLLSALLSALTSAGSAVRRPEMAQAIGQVAAAGQTARGTIVAEACRPAASAPRLGDAAKIRIGTAFAFVPVIAPWASRRRE